jgi:hypothetical protein
MKNLLFHLKVVKTGTHRAEVGAKPEGGNFLKIRSGAGAKTNSFGSATLDEWQKSRNEHK